jgi:nifR3 family TIM-barrel protein
MTSLLTPIFLGNLKLPNNVFYAPLAGCSDYPFRWMSSQYSPGLIFCEMVKMDALIRNDPVTLHMLDYDTSMHPIAAQLCGSKPQIAGKAAKIIEDLGFDAVDLNCGCPVDKVTKDGSGSGMLKNPQLIGEVLANMVAAVKIPVTVKIRA